MQEVIQVFKVSIHPIKRFQEHTIKNIKIISKIFTGIVDNKRIKISDKITILMIKIKIRIIGTILIIKDIIITTDLMNLNKISK